MGQILDDSARALLIRYDSKLDWAFALFNGNVGFERLVVARFKHLEFGPVVHGQLKRVSFALEHGAVRSDAAINLPFHLLKILLHLLEHVSCFDGLKVARRCLVTGLLLAQNLVLLLT